MSRLFFGVLENALKVMLALMVVLVFGNVVLRYGFNSGITMSEEISRFLFVWLIFLGAFVTLRDRGHLGVNGLVRLLPYRGQRAVRVSGDAASLLCCLLLGLGAWRQVVDNMANYSPVAGVPLGIVYFSCVASAVGMAALFAKSIYEVAAGRIADEDIFATHGEDLIE